MFRAPLCPSSGARDYYTGGCWLWYLVLFGFQVVGMVCNWGLCVRFAGSLSPLMMGIMVPETCWASNNICNKNHLLHLVGVSFPHITVAFRNIANALKNSRPGLHTQTLQITACVTCTQTHRHARLTTGDPFSTDIWQTQAAAAPISHVNTWNESQWLHKRNKNVLLIACYWNNTPLPLRLRPDGFGGLVVSILAIGTRVRGFKPGRSRWIFRASGKSSVCLPSEGK